MSLTIHLEQLEHQEEALLAILEAFPALDETSNESETQSIYANPLLKHNGDESYFIDCKMETGTGKTYVYTRLMYELHKRLGLFKFILIVPTLAIREGSASFIQSGYARQHFSRFYPNTQLELQTIKAGDFSGKGGRKIFPGGLTQFTGATRNERTAIQCLLLCSKGFLDKSTSSLFRDDYDQTLMGLSSCPAEALRMSRPVVIIDEPHRIKRDSATYRNLIEKINPQMVIRFGATFPEVSSGRGRTSIDYYRGTPTYDLGAIRSFNQGLVKAVDVHYPELVGDMSRERYRVKSATNRELVLAKDNRDYHIYVGENLAIANAEFEGNIEYLGGADRKLSNELGLAAGMQLIPGTFMQSYQELLLKHAIDMHFEKEKTNFYRDNEARVKTLSLFFIDSIPSYRKQDGWLKVMFERLLKEKLDDLLSEATGEYRKFLLATREDIEKVHGGYFAEDRAGKTADDKIAAEVDDILRNKEKLLTFQNEDGTWNTRRFLFSKWTLREGWDNPNVFVICKLRSSGSETSKIQEVGRGLRLPVDERGNRLSNEEFRLDFILGYDEKDFADRLLGEINADSSLELSSERLTDDMIAIIVGARDIDISDLCNELGEKGMIDFSRTFIAAVERDGQVKTGYEWLLIDYPELLDAQVRKGKVTSPQTRGTQPKIRLRQENWNRIKSVWEDICQRYMLHYQRLDQSVLEDIVEDVLNDEDVFNQQIAEITLRSIVSADGEMRLERQTIPAGTTSIGKLPYGAFIKRLHKRTYLPVALLHKKVHTRLRSLTPMVNDVNDLINESAVDKFASLFAKRFAEEYAERYEYDSLDYSANSSVFKKGIFLDEIEQGVVGNYEFNTNDDPRNLYDVPLAYDSELEREVMQVRPNDRITVFGKIPRRAIAVPNYTGGSTTPDFIYHTESASNGGRLSLLVETKTDDMRSTEEWAVSSQEKFFAGIEGVNWKLANTAEDVIRALEGM